jgi:hypothetical protein
LHYAVLSHFKLRSCFETKKPPEGRLQYSVSHIASWIPYGLALAPCKAGCRAVTGPVPHATLHDQFLYLLYHQSKKTIAAKKKIISNNDSHRITFEITDWLTPVRLIKSSWFPYLRTIIDLSALISVKNNFLTLLYYGHLSRKITLINSSI